MDSPAPASGSEIETREQFAAALTALRTRAGFSIRGLAQAINTPAATVGDYCSGRHLPGPAQQELFCTMLSACGVTEPELQAWLEVVTRLRAGSDGRMRRANSPYQGLAPFAVEDRERFFGRDAVIGEILERLRAQVRGAAPPGPVLIVGPSGAGKSSLLRAGVQAQIEAGALGSLEDPWFSCLFTPGEDPLATLRRHLTQAQASRRVVIVDQLEELFASAPAEQERFMEELVGLAQSGTLVLGGLRADFYEQAVRAPALLASLRANPVLLGPMTREELRSAILGPARYAGVQVEDGLVELVLADLAPRDASEFAHDAGSLPLLSHALHQSWERAHGNRLTIAEYRATGGLQGAVRQTAEGLYNQLSADQQELARRIFMRLVRVPEDGPAVRRRAHRHELTALDRTARGGDQPAPLGARSPAVDEVVDLFVNARLLTVGSDTVELSHEALLHAWPRLAEWIERNRDGLRLHRLLTDASNEWLAGGRRPELLLREARLQLIGEWSSDPANRAELNADERNYLAESQDLALRRRLAARRRARQMRLLVSVSTLSAIAAIALAAIALRARENATHARNQALSRQVALEAGSVTPTDPSLAMQLAVLSHEIAPTTGATSALLDASEGELPTRITGPTGPAFLGSAAAAGRLAVAYSAADRVRVYALGRPVPRLLATVSAGPASEQVFAVALSPDGQLLAAAGTTHQVILWSLRRPGHPSRVAVLPLRGGTVYGLAFSRDGRTLAAVNATHSVALWSIDGAAAPRPEPPLSAPVDTEFHAVAFAPSGRGLAAAGTGGTVAIWSTPAAGRPPATLTVAGAPTLYAVSFNPAGTVLAAGGTDDAVDRWALSAGRPAAPLAALHGFTSWIESLAYSADGRMLAVGSSDSSLRVWSTAGAGSQPAVLEHPAPVTGVAFTAEDAGLITVDSAGTLRSWTMPVPSERRAPGEIFALAYTSTGRELSVISSGPHADAQLWRTGGGGDPSLLANISLGSFGAAAGAGALRSDGRLLAVANGRAQVRLVDLSDPRHPHAVGPVLSGATPYIEQMAFNRAGNLLAAGDDAGHIHLWSVANPDHPVTDPTLNLHAPPQIMLGVAFSPSGRLLASASTSGAVSLWAVRASGHASRLATAGRISGYAYTVAFTPDGHTLIAAGADRSVHLWNVTSPAHPVPLGKPLQGPTSIIYDVAVSPDGTRLAAATTDGSVWLWDISDPSRPRLIADLTGSKTDLYAVSFEPHSNTLIAGGADRQLHLWDDSPGDLTGRICALAGTPLTRAEWAQYVENGSYRRPCG